jgi:hypothetical protein
MDTCIPHTRGLVLAAPPLQASAQDAVDLVKRGIRLDGSQEMIACGYKRKRNEQSPVLGVANVLAAHAQQQAAAVDHIMLKNVMYVPWP